jgi:L-threonylcarbamoyladenylate synthase
MDLSLLNAVSNLEQSAGVIALPVGTSYVLACRADHDEALARLRRVKGFSEPWLLIGWEMDALRPFVQTLPEAAEHLMEAYWPGPLVLMLSKSDALSAEDAEPSQVKLLQPQEAIVQDLLALIPGGVLVTTCAGRFRDQPACTAEAVLDTFGDDVDYVLVDDETVKDAESPTVAAIEMDGRVRVLRSGRIVLD